MCKPTQPGNASLSCPEHVAIIMDGNRRWAREKNRPQFFGHKQGVNRLKDILDAALEAGVRYLTVYMFSTENWKRAKDEVSYLLDLFRDALRNSVEEHHQKGICLRAIGDMSAFPEDIQRLSVVAEEKTKGNAKLCVQLALNYGGRAEIVHAAREIAKKVFAGTLDPQSLTEDLFSAQLFTKGTPDPDLLIRTGGEQRVSNFLLWQLAYTEFVFFEKFWPEFSREDFFGALEIYATRQRRHGK